MSSKRGKKKAFLRSLLGKSLLVPAGAVPGRIAPRSQDGSLVPGRVTAIDKVNPGCVVVRLEDDTRRFFFRGELVQQWVTEVQRPQGANHDETTGEDASMQEQHLQPQQEEGEDDSYDAAGPAPRQTVPGTSTTPWCMHTGGVAQPSTVPLYHHSTWMRRFVFEDFLLKQQAAAAAARERHEEEASGTTQHPGETRAAGMLQSAAGWEREAAARPSNSCSHGDQQSIDTGDDHRHAAAQQAHDLSITAAAATATGLPGLAEAALQEAQQEQLEQQQQQQEQQSLKQQPQGISAAQRHQSPALSTGQHSFNPASQQRMDSKHAAAPTPAPGPAAAASDRQAGDDEQAQQPPDTSQPGATSSSVPPPPASVSWEKPKRGRTKRSQCVDLIGQVVEVPGNVFDVDVPELVYRGKVVGPDNAHADAVVLRLLEDGTKFYFPIGQVRSWLGEQTKRHRQHAPCTGQHTTGALSDAFAAEVLASMSAGPSSTSQLSHGGAAAAKPTNSHTCTSQQRQLQGPARRKQRFADSGRVGDGGGGDDDEEGEVAAA